MKIRYLAAVLALLSLVSLFAGVKEIRPSDLLHLSEGQAQVLLISRIPRLISILIAGSALSIVGLIMQQISRNKFVSPTTAGTMDSAGLGILVSLLVFTGAGPIHRMAFAFAFALAGTFVFMRILERIKFRDSVFIPLVGLMFGNIVSSAATFLAYKHDLVQSMSAWLFGDFSVIMTGRYEMLYISVPLVALAYLFANRFTIAGMGEEFAVNLGLPYRRVVNLALLIIAMVSASVILTVGRLPFVGLIIPNIVTIYAGDNLKRSLPATAMLGAAFVLVCDILGRLLLYPYEIPIGLTIGVIGSGVFLYLLLRRKAHV